MTIQWLEQTDCNIAKEFTLSVQLYYYLDFYYYSLPIWIYSFKYAYSVEGCCLCLPLWENGHEVEVVVGGYNIEQFIH